MNFKETLFAFCVAIGIFIILIFVGIVMGWKNDASFWERQAKIDRTLLFQYAEGKLKIPKGFKLYGLGCCAEGNSDYLLIRNKKEQELYVKYNSKHEPEISKSYFGRPWKK